MIKAMPTRARVLEWAFRNANCLLGLDDVASGRDTLALCRRAEADYALVGSVSEAGEKLRVTVRLLSCELQACIWADSYIREGNDLFAVQEEIARSIACALRGNLYR